MGDISRASVAGLRVPARVQQSGSINKAGTRTYYNSYVPCVGAEWSTWLRVRSCSPNLHFFGSLGRRSLRRVVAYYFWRSPLETLVNEKKFFTIVWILVIICLSFGQCDLHLGLRRGCEWWGFTVVETHLLLKLSTLLNHVRRYSWLHVHARFWAGCTSKSMGTSNREAVNSGSGNWQDVSIQGKLIVYAADPTLHSLPSVPLFIRETRFM